MTSAALSTATPDRPIKIIPIAIVEPAATPMKSRPKRALAIVVTAIAVTSSAHLAYSLRNPGRIPAGAASVAQAQYQWSGFHKVAVDHSYR